MPHYHYFSVRSSIPLSSSIKRDPQDLRVEEACLLPPPTGGEPARPRDSPRLHAFPFSLQQWGLIMLPRLVSSSWIRAILPPWPLCFGIRGVSRHAWSRAFPFEVSTEGSQKPTVHHPRPEKQVEIGRTVRKAEAQVNSGPRATRSSLSNSKSQKSRGAGFQKGHKVDLVEKTPAALEKGGSNVGQQKGRGQ